MSTIASIVNLVRSQVYHTERLPLFAARLPWCSASHGSSATADICSVFNCARPPHVMHWMGHHCAICGFRVVPNTKTGLALNEHLCTCVCMCVCACVCACMSLCLSLSLCFTGWLSLFCGTLGNVNNVHEQIFQQSYVVAPVSMLPQYWR